MLTALNEPAERVSTAHRAKPAYIYVRQFTAGHVRQHQESTELQYRLADRAAGLGWPRERITVIDDLGKSGASSAERHGFQRLIAEIGLGKAGMVLSLDVSRLTRNNRDWHQLLELCSVFGVVIGDGERLPDPGVYRDRLLLGLSGIVSEAELQQIRMRLHQGERQRPRAASYVCRCRPASPTGAAARSFSTRTRRCRRGCGWCSACSRRCRAPRR